MRWVDPFGLRIVVQGSANDKWDYLQAIAYLKNDPGMAKVIDYLDKSSATYTIITNSYGSDTYDPLTKNNYLGPK